MYELSFFSVTGLTPERFAREHGVNAEKELWDEIDEYIDYCRERGEDNFDQDDINALFVELEDAFYDFGEE